MDYTDENISVTSTSDEQYSAGKREKKHYLKEERIRSRIWELDFLRGICVLLMIFDHFMYDLGFVFADIWVSNSLTIEAANFYSGLGNFAVNYWFSDLRSIVRPVVIMTFFLICGISCSFSRSNFKRGTMLLGIALIMSAVTIPIGQPILFGVLHMLSIAILLVALLKVITRGDNKTMGITCFSLGAFMIITEIILQASHPAPNSVLCVLSKAFFDGTNFKSMDYFPLLPNVGYVLIGASMAKLLYPTKRTLFSCLDTQFRWYRPVNFFGRNAAIFYILHQVAWAALFALFTLVAIPNGWQVLVDNFFSGF